MKANTVTYLFIGANTEFLLIVPGIIWILVQCCVIKKIAVKDPEARVGLLFFFPFFAFFGRTPTTRHPVIVVISIIIQAQQVILGDSTILNCLVELYKMFGNQLLFQLWLKTLNHHI